MIAWQVLLDAFRSALFALSHVYGGSLGCAILTLSLVSRLAVMAVSLRARRKSTRVVAGFAQIPVVAALYSVIREGSAGSFIWITNLARPDALLTAGVATLSAIAVLTTPTGGSAAAAPQRILGMISVVMTVVILSKMSAGMGLYWAASNVIGVANNVLAPRRKH